MTLLCQTDAFEVQVGDTEPGPARTRVDRVIARDGETLLWALQQADAPITSVCGGQAACAACRIEIAPEWLDRLPPADKNERLLLDYLDDALPAHRLACQLVMTPALSGLAFTIAPVP